VYKNSGTGVQIQSERVYKNPRNPHFILVFLVLICIGVSEWAIADAASRPESAFVGAGTSKVMWVALIAGFIVVFAPVGLILAIVYLSSVRPRLMKVI
jgi:hypothetical protein